MAVKRDAVLLSLNDRVAALVHQQMKSARLAIREGEHVCRLPIKPYMGNVLSLSLAERCSLHEGFRDRREWQQVVEEGSSAGWLATPQQVNPLHCGGSKLRPITCQPTRQMIKALQTCVCLSRSRGVEFKQYKQHKLIYVLYLKLYAEKRKKRKFSEI